MIYPAASGFSVINIIKDFDQDNGILKCSVTIMFSLFPGAEFLFQISTFQGSRETQRCYMKKFLEFPTDSFIKIRCPAIIVRTQVSSLRRDYCRKD